jgi:hypothetical protein
VIRKLLFGLALAWAAFALLAEVQGAAAGYDLRQRFHPSAIGWRFGIPQVERLQLCVDAARPLLPAGGRVAFASRPDGDAFFRHRWAAYLLPEVDLVPWDDPAGKSAPLLLSYSYRIDDDPRLNLLRRLPAGFLYQVQAQVQAQVQDQGKDR